MLVCLISCHYFEILLLKTSDGSGRAILRKTPLTGICVCVVIKDIRLVAAQDSFS